MASSALYEIKLKDNFSVGIKNAEKNTDQFEKKINNLNKGISTLGVTLGLAAAAAAGAAFKKISNLGAAAESTAISFRVLAGDAETGIKLLAELKNYSVITPYYQQDILDAGKLLLGYGMTAKKVMPTIKMLGDIAGGDAQRLYSLSLSFGQMSAAGRLMGQDLLQMINVGFNPLNIIAEKTGLSMLQLRKKMEAGGISANDVARAFRFATSEGGIFFNMTEKQSKSFAGKMSTVTDNLTVLFTTMGEKLNVSLTPILDKILDVLNRSTNIGASQTALKNFTDQSNQSSLLRGLFESYKQYGSLGAKSMQDDMERNILEKFPSLANYSTTGASNGLDTVKTENMINALGSPKSPLYEMIQSTQSIQKRISQIADELSTGKNKLMTGDNLFGLPSPIDIFYNLSKTDDDRKKELDKLQKELLQNEKMISEYRAGGGGGKAAANALAKLVSPVSNKFFNSSRNPAGAGGGNSTDIGMEKIQLGTRNITLNIDKLVGEITFEQTLQGSEQATVDIVKRVLLTAVNDVNLVSQ